MGKSGVETLDKNAVEGLIVAVRELKSHGLRKNSIKGLGLQAERAEIYQKIWHG
jgi:hypothetical protein